MNRVIHLNLRILRSFAVYAAQDDGADTDGHPKE
jgi:hypothetical protein